MAKYLKLGERAQTFYDVNTGLHINNNQVVKLLNDEDLKKKSIKIALSTQHIVPATEAEWLAYQEEKKKHNLEAQVQYKKTKKQEAAVKIAKAKEEAGDDEDPEELGEEGEEENTGEDVTDSLDEMTNSDLIDFLKDSKLVKEDQKKGLTKLNRGQLINIYNTVNPPKSKE